MPKRLRDTSHWVRLVSTGQLAWRAHRLQRPQLAQLLFPVRIVLGPEPLAGAPRLTQRLRDTSLAVNSSSQIDFDRDQCIRALRH